MTENTPVQDESVQPSGISRRSVVRTAGRAAWAVPVVVAISGAPASAAGLSGPALVTTTVTTSKTANQKSLTVTVVFSNANTGSTTVAPVVTVTAVLGTVTGPPTNVTGGTTSSTGTTVAFSSITIPGYTGATQPAVTISFTLVVAGPGGG